MKKSRLLALLCVVAMIASLIVVPTYAEDEIVCTHCGTAPTEWTAWDGATKFTAGGHYYIESSLTLTGRFTISDAMDICLDLRGNTLTAKANAYTNAFTLNNAEASLNIMDTTKSGSSAVLGSGTAMSYDGGVIHVTAGEMNIYDITVSGGTGTTKLGGNVWVAAGSVFNAKNCTISGGSAKQGGNIYNNGTVTLVDTTVSDGVGNNNNGGANIYNNAGMLDLKGTTTLSGGKNTSAYSSYPAGTNILSAGGTVNIYEGVKIETCADVALARQKYDIQTNGAVTINMFGGKADNLNLVAAASLNVYGGEIDYLYNLGAVNVYNGKIGTASAAVTVAACDQITTAETVYHHAAGDCADCGRSFVDTVTDADTQSAVAHIMDGEYCTVPGCALANPDSELRKADCSVCGESHEWTEWDGTTAIKDAGAYYITADITDAEAIYPTAGTTGAVCVDLNGFSLTAPVYKQLVLAHNATVNVMDTTKSGNSALNGNGIFSGNGGVVRATTGGIINLYDITVQGGRVTDAKHGGNISVDATSANVTLQNVKVLNGQTNALGEGGITGDGGNIAVNNGTLTLINVEIKGGTTNGTGAGAFGGNLFVNGAGTVVNINGATVTGGSADDGDDVFGMANNNGTTTLNVFDATIGDLMLRNEGTRVTNFNMFAGSVDSFKTGGASSDLNIYNGTFGFNPAIAGYEGASILGDCAYAAPNSTGYTVYHIGDHPCTTCSAAAGSNVTVYEFVGVAGTVAIVDGVHKDQASAFTDSTVTGNTVLVADVNVEKLVLASGATLDLNGNTLTVTDTLDGLTYDGQITGAGKIYGNVMFNKNNAALPITVTDGSETYTVLETPDVVEKNNAATAGAESHKFSLYVNDKAAATWLDEAVNAGTVKIVVRVSYNDGEAKTQDFELDATLAAAYVAAWDDKQINLNLTGLTGLTDVSCETVLVSGNVEY